MKYAFFFDILLLSLKVGGEALYTQKEEMKMKKFVATLLSVAMIATMVLWVPGTAATAEAADSIYHRNIKFTASCSSSVIPRVSVSTPAVTAALYAGMTYEQNALGFDLTVDVSDQPATAPTNAIVQYTAFSNSYKIEANLNVDFRVASGIFYARPTELAKPVRIAVWLPKDYDPNRDYGAVILKTDGTCEIRGDLDLAPDMITFDTKYVSHIAIVSAPRGSFDAYKIADPASMEQLIFPVWNSAIPSTIPTTENICQYSKGGVITPWAEVKAELGDYSWLSFQDWFVNPENNLVRTFEQAKKACGGKYISYIDPYLYSNGKEIEQTAKPYILTFAVPADLPAYGEYAVAVCNMDGTVSVYKDIDLNDNTVSVYTNLFRKYGIIWGFEGTLKEVR